MRLLLDTSTCIEILRGKQATVLARYAACARADNRINPYAYLVSLFRRLPVALTADDFEALLPWRLMTSS